MRLKRIIPQSLVPSLQKIRYLGLILVYNLMKTFIKPNPKNVFFLVAHNNYLSDNLLFIHNELQNYDFKLYVEIYYKTASFHKLKILYLMCKSKYTLIDDFCPLLYPLKIRKGTMLIQVWHALGAFKTVGFSRIGKPGGPSATSLTHRNYTATIVSSEAIVPNYAEAFGISEDKVHPIGIPRTDIFFNKKYIKDITKKIYQTIPELKNKKIILFAPTFRGNGKNTAHYPSEYFDLDKIYPTLKDKYILLIKHHPFIKDKINIKTEYQDCIIDISHYPDINELLFITDILITDYSSVIFEYSFFNKPLIMYVPDLKEYIASRDFYYSFEEYNYGLKCENLKQLISAIEKPKVDAAKIKKFKEKFMKSCDGKATKRFIDEFLK